MSIEPPDSSSEDIYSTIHDGRQTWPTATPEHGKPSTMQLNALADGKYCFY